MLANAKQSLKDMISTAEKVKLRRKILLFTTVYQSWDRTDDVVVLYELFMAANQAQRAAEATGQ